VENEQRPRRAPHDDRTIHQRRPELSDSEFLCCAARSITESTEQIRDALERLEMSLGIEPPSPQLRLLRSTEADR
jgi:hypothetical protein